VQQAKAIGEYIDLDLSEYVNRQQYLVEVNHDEE